MGTFLVWKGETESGRGLKHWKGQNLSWLPGGPVGQRINVTLTFLGPCKQGRGIQTRGLVSLFIKTHENAFTIFPAGGWRRDSEEGFVERKKSMLKERWWFLEAKREDKVRCTLESVFRMTEGRMGVWSIFSPQSSELHGNLCYCQRDSCWTPNKGKRGQGQDGGREETQKRDEGTQARAALGEGSSLCPSFVNIKTSPSPRGRLQWWERYIIWWSLVAGMCDWTDQWRDNIWKLYCSESC